MGFVYFIVGYGLGYHFFKGVTVLRANPFLPYRRRQEIVQWMGAAMLAWFGVLLSIP